MPTLLQKASKEAAKPQTETDAYLLSYQTGRAVTWSKGRVEAGAYRPGAIMAMCRRAARSAAKRFPRADLEELAADLVEAALSKGPQRGELPRVGEIGTDSHIADPMERDRAYLMGIARHKLADMSRSEGAEVESLDVKLSDLSELPSISALMEEATAQAHTDPGLVDPDADPVNRDVWRAVERFPTKDAGRAALSHLIGTGATRAQLAKQAGLSDPKDWHRSVKRGRAQLQRLAHVPLEHWTAKDQGMAEALAHLVETCGPDHPGVGVDALLAQAPPTYRAPNTERPWRTKPEHHAPVTTTRSAARNAPSADVERTAKGKG